MSSITKVPFYTIERAIKTYRQLAQRRLVAAGSSITVDQWLVLNVIEADPGIQQGLIADLVFKDKASIARMVDLLVQAGLVQRTTPEDDRRTVRLKLTGKGGAQLAALAPIVKSYRAQALKGVTKGELEMLMATLDKIMANCDE